MAADELDPDLVREVLAENALPAGSRIQLEPLGGGVSGEVTLVSVDDRESLVLKRPRTRLNVAAEWLIDPGRAVNEARCLDYLSSFLPAGTVPTVRFVDSERRLFAMTVLPPPRVTWKQQLLAGTVLEPVAVSVAELLAVIHRFSSEDPQVPADFDRYDLFVQARIDPFHRVVAARRPRLAAAIEEEISRLEQTRRVLCWGDASPKNVFVYPDRVCFFDVEIAHWGDPAFDVAYFLTHLILKATVLKSSRDRLLSSALAFWNTYRRAAPAWPDLQASTLTEVGCLLLARVEGKSPVEYLRDRADRDAVIALGSRLLLKPVPTVAELLEGVGRGSLLVADGARA